MKRRQFFAAGAGIAATLATSGAKGDAPQVTWRLTSSFPKSRDLLFGASEHFAARLAEITAGRFLITVAPSGEIASGLQALDAVADGRADVAHSFSNYFVGKDPGFCFGTGLPFGPQCPPA